MANVANTYLSDKDISNFTPKNTLECKRSKVFYIFICQSTIKTFSIKINDKYIKLKRII